MWDWGWGFGPVHGEFKLSEWALLRKALVSPRTSIEPDPAPECKNTTEVKWLIVMAQPGMGLKHALSLETCQVGLCG